VNLGISLMFVAIGAAMIALGANARRSPDGADQDPRLWFAAGAFFLLAAAISLATHFIS